MTAITNTYLTTGANKVVGQREDLTDAIWNISPTMTPFTSKIGKEKAKAIYHSWQTDALAAPNLGNAFAEGDDVSSYDVATPTSLLGNYCQIARKTVIVSATTEAVDKAGRKSELAYQITKKGKELRRDIESICLNNQAKSASGARTLAGVESWIKTNTDKGTGVAADPTAADGTGTRTDGTTRVFSETSFKNVLQSIFAASGEIPDLCLLPPKQKQIASTFNNGRTVFNKAESGTLEASIDVYSSDFGDIQLVPSLFNRGSATAGSVYLLNTDYWALANLRPIQQEELAKTGDAEKRLLVTEFTLVSRNEAASGGIYDLS
jgi:Family of unknown function (DUF5309)